MKTHRQSMTEAIASVLTTEQQGMFARTMERLDDRNAMRQARREVFLNSLELSDEQREQWDAMRSSHRSAMRIWQEQNPDATREEMDAFRDAMHASGRASLEKILTPEQLAKLDEHSPRRRHRGRERGRDR